MVVGGGCRGLFFARGAGGDGGGDTDEDDADDADELVAGLLPSGGRVFGGAADRTTVEEEGPPEDVERA